MIRWEHLIFGLVTLFFLVGALNIIGFFIWLFLFYIYGTIEGGAVSDSKGDITEIKTEKKCSIGHKDCLYAKEIRIY